jgi:hypothetical protein
VGGSAKGTCGRIWHTYLGGQGPQSRQVGDGVAISKLVCLAAAVPDDLVQASPLFLLCSLVLQGGSMGR